MSELAGMPGVSPSAELPAEQPLVAIIADRGAGKSTLLGQWAQALSSGGAVQPTWLDAAEISTDLVDSLRTAAEPQCIMIDDYHQVADEGFAAWLLSSLGRNQHRFFVAARPAPGLPLPRWRASGLLAEYGTGDLRLGAEQITGLARSRHLDLDAGILEGVRALTDGLASGVVSILDRLAAAPADAAEKIESHDLVEHAAIECGVDLVGEIEAEIAADDYEFLLQTSILGEMDQGLARAVTRPVQVGDPVDLAGLVRRVPFTEPIDGAGRVIRVHPLVRLGLRRQLADREESRETAARHRAAARHIESVGRARDAVDHYLAAGEPERAADALAAAWTRDQTSIADEDIERLAKAGAADYVPHLVTTAMAHLRSERFGLAALQCHRLAEMSWDGPLPSGYPSLGAAVADLRGRLPEQTVGHMEGLVESVDPAGAGATGPRDLASRYTAAHYCYWLGRLDEARARASLVLVGHRAIGRDRRIDQTVTVLASYLVALIDHDHGEVVEARRHIVQAEALIAEYGFDSLDDVSSQAGEVARLVRAIAGEASAADRLDMLEGLVAAAVNDWPRIMAAIESVRLLDRLARFDEAGAAFARLGEMAEGRDLPPLLAGRVAQLGEALRPDQGVVGPAMHITAGERAVLYLLADQSLSQTEIGLRLGLSINTVKSHLRSIYQKLGVAGRREAVERAAEEGMMATVQPWLPGSGRRSP